MRLVALTLLLFAVLPARSTMTRPAGSVRATGLHRPDRTILPRRLPMITGDPIAVDLSRWDPPVGNQENVGSCAAWATTYNARYWLLAHDTGAIVAGSFAPMFEYVNATGGVDTGSRIEDNLGVEQTYGAVPDAQYAPKPSDSNGPHAGRYDYRDSPSVADTTAAAPYRIGGYRILYELDHEAGYPGGAALIRSELAQDHPVILGIAVRDPFMFAGARYSTVVEPGGLNLYGYHAVMADGYNSAGVTIINQWGTGWGDGGHATLSWDFINSETFQAVAVFGPPAPIIPTPTAMPVIVPTVRPTPPLRPTPHPVHHHRKHHPRPCGWISRPCPS